MDTRFTVKNLVLGSDNLDRMKREIELVFRRLMVAVRRSTRFNAERHYFFGVDREWHLEGARVGLISLWHLNAGRLYDNGRFDSPPALYIRQVHKDLQVLVDGLIEHDPGISNDLVFIINAADA